MTTAALEQFLRAQAEEQLQALVPVIDRALEASSRGHMMKPWTGYIGEENVRVSTLGSGSVLVDGRIGWFLYQLLQDHYGDVRVSRSRQISATQDNSFVIAPEG